MYRFRWQQVKRKEKEVEYRKFGDIYYIRFDKGDEIISGILGVCRKEGVMSAVFSGIGGCSMADIRTFIPETGTFESRLLEGMLELVSLNGNVVTDDAGDYYHHTHAVFSYKDGEKHMISAGHMQSVVTLYTAEIELRPVAGGNIKRKYDSETGTGFWDFQD